MIKSGTVFAGRYEIIERIGSGGMADVYKAHDARLKRDVAIKVLKSSLSEDSNFVEKFRTEGEAAASLTNANVVSVYDVGNVGSTYYIVMELIDGITLKDYIRRKGMLSSRETMAISAQVPFEKRTMRPSDGFRCRVSRAASATTFPSWALSVSNRPSGTGGSSAMKSPRTRLAPRYRLA